MEQWGVCILIEQEYIYILMEQQDVFILMEHQCVYIFIAHIRICMLMLLRSSRVFVFLPRSNVPASILRQSTSGRHRPVSYPDGPMTARYRFT